MPGTDGLDLLRRLRCVQARVPAMALSGAGPNGGFLYAKAARCIGADASVLKPVDVARLLAAAHRLVKRRRGEAPLQTPVSAA